MNDYALIVAPGGRDAAIIAAILQNAGIAGRAGTTVDLVDAIGAQACGVAVVAEEALPGIDLPRLAQALADQPPWADFPIILMTRRNSRARNNGWLHHILGNVTLLERPVHPETLVSAASTALRARARQRRAATYLAERERAEEQVRAFAATLESRVAERTAEVEKVSLEREAALERLQRAQSELIHVSRLSAMGAMASTMAHELNQPLTAVVNYMRGCLRLISAGQDGSSATIVNALTEAGNSAARAGEILRRLRSMVTKDQLERTSENVADLLGRACDIALVNAHLLGIEYEVLVDPALDQVVVDPIQIQQVLLNLIRNAVEALQGSDRPAIYVCAAVASGDFCQITVRDNGTGVLPEVMEHLFSTFNSSKAGGMGIGLSICRTIIELHGGEIWGENGDEGGAAFHFTVPRFSPGLSGPPAR